MTYEDEVEAIRQATGKTPDEWKISDGYLYMTIAPDGSVCCLYQFMFTWAILADLNYCGYGDRWCYHTLGDAMRGYLEWISRDYKGEPFGWHRHPASGRRDMGDHCEATL